MEQSTAPVSLDEMILSFGIAPTLERVVKLLRERDAQRRSEIHAELTGGLHQALSMLDEAEGQANDAYDSAESAVQEAARARDYAAEAQSKIEDVKAEIGAVLNDG